METKSSPQKTNHIKCIVCDKDLTGRQRKFCSIQCKNNSHQNYERQQERGLERKTKLVKLKGGQCSECGYAKNYSALSFHHIDPQAKKFKLDIRSCSNRKWPALLEECLKCELLCLNCHAEEHNPRLYLDRLL